MEQKSIRFKPNANLDQLGKIFGFQVENKMGPIAHLNNDAVSRIMMLSAMVSTPYVLLLLFKLKKYKWLLFFGVFVALPIIIIGSIEALNELKPLTPILVLFCDFIFLFCLKNTYQDWREPIFIPKRN